MIKETCFNIYSSSIYFYCGQGLLKLDIDFVCKKNKFEKVKKFPVEISISKKNYLSKSPS